MLTIAVIIFIVTVTRQLLKTPEKPSEVAGFVFISLFLLTIGTGLDYDAYSWLSGNPDHSGLGLVFYTCAGIGLVGWGLYELFILADKEWEKTQNKDQ